MRWFLKSGLSIGEQEKSQVYSTPEHSKDIQESNEVESKCLAWVPLPVHLRSEIADRILTLQLGRQGPAIAVYRSDLENAKLWVRLYFRHPATYDVEYQNIAASGSELPTTGIFTIKRFGRILWISWGFHEQLNELGSPGIIKMYTAAESFRTASIRFTPASSNMLSCCSSQL